jgi:hypothetical protein
MARKSPEQAHREALTRLVLAQIDLLRAAVAHGMTDAAQAHLAEVTRFLAPKP